MQAVAAPEVLSKLFNTAPAHSMHALQASWINTILGPMIAIADDKELYLLEFIGKKNLEKEIQNIQARGFAIIPGETAVIKSITSELAAYFAGTLKQFQTPYRVLGSSFQKTVWQALTTIPYGETKSYQQQAITLGKPTAYRAVGNANGANQLSIIIPCHRVIASDGTLGGYGGGLDVKLWLLEHEKRHQDN